MATIPGADVFHPRSDWEDPKFPVNGGGYTAPRAIINDIDTSPIHYPWADSPDGDASDLVDVSQFLRNIQHFYRTGSRGYSIGYNFAVDHKGEIWELRGYEYKCAANLHHNGHTAAILMLVDWKDGATQAAIDSANLIIAETQRRSGNVQHVCGHNELRLINGKGTATACCGEGLYAQLHAGLIHGPDMTNLPPISAYNPPGNWGLFPLDGNKRFLQVGSTGQHVRYLQDALSLSFGQTLVRDGKFGDQTEQKLKNVQNFFGVDNASGTTLPDTWGLIDWGVAGFPVSPPPPPPPAAEYVPVGNGYYVIQPGEWPYTVARKTYGDGNRWPELAPATPNLFTNGNANTNWKAGAEVKVPDIPGRRVQAKSGEGAYSMIDRLGYAKTAANLEIFYDWNGGDPDEGGLVVQFEQWVYLPNSM